MPSAMMSVPRHAVLQRASKGPFLCVMCEYYLTKGACTHPYIIEEYGPAVAPGDCCDFYTRGRMPIFLKSQRRAA